MQTCAQDSRRLLNHIDLEQITLIASYLRPISVPLARLKWLTISVRIEFAFATWSVKKYLFGPELISTKGDLLKQMYLM